MSPIKANINNFNIIMVDKTIQKKQKLFLF